MISQSMIQGVNPLNKKPRKGDTVLYYYCDGCMATDHTLRYVGKVVGFYSQKLHGCGKKYRFAKLKILKREHQGHDSRDGDLGIEKVCIDDSSFQKLDKGIWLCLK